MYMRYKQEKKIKGIRKKIRDEEIERLMLKFPIWFEGKSKTEIRDLVNAFRNSNKSDDEFVSFCISYENSNYK